MKTSASRSSFIIIGVTTGVIKEKSQKQNGWSPAGWGRGPLAFPSTFLGNLIITESCIYITLKNN